MKIPWMIDELAHAGPEHLDFDLVAGYDRKQGYDPSEDVAILREHGVDQHIGPPADAVYSRNALHQLPDFWKAVALDRIARILRPRGVLRLRDLIFDFQPAEADPIVERWLSDAADDPAGGYTRDDLAAHLRFEYSTFRWLLEPMLAAAGFEVVQADFSRSVYGAYTCVGV